MQKPHADIALRSCPAVSSIREGVKQCSGCGTRRLQCWMAKPFEHSFYRRVERLFFELDTDSDGHLSKKEFRAFLEKTNEKGIREQCVSDDGWADVLIALHTTVKRGVDAEALCYMYHGDDGSKL